MDLGYISQLQPLILVKTEPLAIKSEPPDIPDSSHEEIIPDIKETDIVWHTFCEDSIKSETVPENIFENAPFVKIENITESENLNKTEDTNDGQEVVEVQGNLETDKHHVLNISTDLNGISMSRKPEHRKKANFSECNRSRETTSWEEVKEKIKVIKAPVIPVEPHEYTSLARGNYVCNHCQRACTKLDNLKRHIKQIHRKAPTMYQCPYCPYKSKWSVEDHIILKHKVTKDIQCFQYRCDMCDYETFIRQNLNKHKLNHLKPEEIKYFHCSYCFYKSTRKCHLKAHIFRHFKNVEIEHEKRHRCDQCSYKTYKPSHLKMHKLIHLKPEEIQYFYCYHCSYKSKQKSHLKIHILRHFEKEETKFHCYMCDFMTLKRELIVDHIKRHSKV